MARLFKDKKSQIEDEFEELEEKQARQLPAVPRPQEPKKENREIVEREVNLSLINDKLNYIIGLIQDSEE